MRLQKFLSRAGVASRRKSEDLILAGRVSVDGIVVTRLGTTVDPLGQRVQVDGREVELRTSEWLALHKPPGYACTRHDPQGRPTVYDLVPTDSRHLPHLGRLDFMSEGLLLFTNDGDLAHRLLHPSSELERRYVVTLLGPVPAEVPDRLMEGVELDDGPAAARTAAWLTPPGGRAPELSIVLTEGRNREIRRMLGAVGLTLRALRRVAFGPIELGTLAAGASRPLTRRERDALATAVDAS